VFIVKTIWSTPQTGFAAARTNAATTPVGEPRERDTCISIRSAYPVSSVARSRQQLWSITSSRIEATSACSGTRRIGSLCVKRVTTERPAVGCKDHKTGEGFSTEVICNNACYCQPSEAYIDQRIARKDGFTMTIHFEATGEKRKELVQALAAATGCEPKYLGAPAFDYQVGAYLVHKDGSLELDDLLDVKEIGLTLHALRARGFISTDSEWVRIEDAPSEQEMQACMVVNAPDCISLGFPKEGMSELAIENVKKLIAAKAPLIKMALELTELPVEVEEDRISFPWLAGTAPHEMVDATARLLAAIIQLSKKLKRVTVIERDTDNPRYAFRCFLLRLGFIGDEYKTVRKYLMKGIPGNGSKRHIPADDESSVQDNVQDVEPVEIERYEKLETQTDVVTEEELTALPCEDA
jgi:hypothetical protein